LWSQGRKGKELELVQSAEKEEHEKKINSMKRSGVEKEKEGMKEKVREIRIVPNDLNDTPSSRSPTKPTPRSPKSTAVSFPGDVAPTPLQMDGKREYEGSEAKRKEIQRKYAPRTPLSFRLGRGR